MMIRSGMFRSDWPLGLVLQRSVLLGAFLYLVVGCMASPEQDRLLRVKESSSPSLHYATNRVQQTERAEEAAVVVILPTGRQSRTDVVRALDTIWGSVADSHNWVVIIPAVPPGLPFGTESGVPFSLGGAGIVGSVLRDARNRGIITDVKRPLFLVEVWGGGLSSSSILDEVPGVFDCLVIAPSATIDIDSLNRLGTAPLRRFVIVLGRDGHGRIERWFRSVSSSQVDLVYANVPAPYATVEGSTDLEQLERDYAASISGILDDRCAESLPIP